jgi:serine/threonine protein kinase
MSDPAYADALPGQYRLHWYVLERVLGQGGFGITYLARDTNLDQAVAIKEYLPVDVAARRPDASVRSRTEDQTERYRWGLDRFIREARTLARFDHPNIVRVLSVFEINNTAYMVMRFEEGENLAALLERRRTLPEEDLRRIVLPILDGLALVHDAGFIHRDIKPDNIHIRSDGSPVLLDFGSARLAHGRSRTVTILVAPGYAPFEQYHSSGETQGPWTDIYSLGATCYRAISGVEPTDAITRSRTELYQNQRDAMVPAVNVGAGRYSPGLLRAIDHALAFAEKDRPQSIAEWRRELSPADDPPPRAPAASPVARPADTGAPQRTASLRGPVIWATLGGLVAAVAVVLILRQVRQEPAPPKPEPITAPTPPEPKPKQLEAAPTPAPPDADRKVREALERKIAALELQMKQETDARLKAEAQRQRDAERARLEAEKRSQAEAEARRQAEARQASLARAEEERRLVEEKRRADAAKKADEARRAEPVRQEAVAAAKKPSAAPGPGEALLAAAQQAAKRGDDFERVDLLRKAATAGNAQAMFELGDAYATGRGVIANNFQAYIYLRRAEVAGFPPAASLVAQVKGKLQPAEIEHAEGLIR